MLEAVRHGAFCAPPHSCGELGRVQLGDSQGAEGVCLVLICSLLLLFTPS